MLCVYFWGTIAMGSFDKFIKCMFLKCFNQRCLFYIINRATMAEDQEF